MNKTLAKTIKYAALPGIVPRLKSFGLNFGYLAYLMAIVFNTVRLLPAIHPYLQIANMGKYGIRQVFAAAFYNLKGGYRNIDQYIVLGGFMMGVILLILQFTILFAAIVTHSAQAGLLGSYGGMFLNSNPLYDVSYMMLDKVFQIPNFFNSSFDPAVSGEPVSLFATGLHALFGFYSRGMLIIACFIIFYYIFVLIVETAQTGVPFGKRFDTIYAPLRLVIAMVLLVPLSYGLNSGQYITLWMAKWGSALATNAWLMHNNITSADPTTNNPLGLTAREMVVSPKIEDISSVVNFYALAHACRAAYYYQYSSVSDDNQPKEIKPYFVKPGTDGVNDSVEMSGQAFDDIMVFFDNAPFKIVFGEKNAVYTQHSGNVKPYCGSITMDIDSKDYGAVRDVYSTYYDFILDQLWTDQDLERYGNRTALIHFPAKGSACDAAVQPPTDWDSPCALAGSKCVCQNAGPAFMYKQRNYYQTTFESAMTAVIDNIRSNPVQQVEMIDAILDLGWGGAGISLYRMAEFNGALVSATIKIPQPTSFPAIMEFIAAQKQKNQASTSAKDRYTPDLKEGDTLDRAWQQADLDVPSIDMGIARYLDAVYRQLDTGDLSPEAGSQRRNANVVMNVINSIYGISGLYELKRNKDVNPMARISALGRSIIEKSITFLGGALVMSGMGGIMGSIDANFSKGFDLISSTISGIGMTGLTVGFIFYYIIPLMPFMYFFFAVGRWVKTIFEAMVGIPLWALAHLRIDGEGIPGQAAANGYFLILEIFLRPILTLFGLMAAFSIFSALVVVLDTIFDVVVQNVGGYNPYDESGAVDTTMLDVAKSALDEFLYTVIYCIILYMLATSSFKLIDLIPNGILRFAGAGVGGFADKVPDPLDSMTRYTAYAGYSMTENLSSAVTSVGRGVGQVTGSVVSGAFKAGSSAGTTLKEGMGAKLGKPNKDL